MDIISADTHTAMKNTISALVTIIEWVPAETATQCPGCKRSLRLEEGRPPAHVHVPEAPESIQEQKDAAGLARVSLDWYRHLMLEQMSGTFTFPHTQLLCWPCATRHLFTITGNVEGVIRSLTTVAGASAVDGVPCRQPVNSLLFLGGNLQQGKPYYTMALARKAYTAITLHDLLCESLRRYNTKTYDREY